jgi:hypothetical protein
MSTEDASEIPNEQPNIRHGGVELVRNDGLEVLLVEDPDPDQDQDSKEDIELMAVKDNVTDIKAQQQERCAMCGEAALQHRIEIRCEDDKRRLGIPEVPANDKLKFLYRCCVGGCPFQTIRHLRHARAFNYHVNKHDMVLNH